MLSTGVAFVIASQLVSQLAAQAPASPAPAVAKLPAKVEFDQGKDGIAVRVDGQALTCYRSAGVPNPVLYPLLAPGGVAVTRNWPMVTAGDEPHDHEHHRSVWFAHGDVDGIDFWTNKGRIEQDGDARLDAAKGCIDTVDRWLGADGHLVATDARRYGFRGGDGWRAIDVDVAMTGVDAPLHFGDTKEGTMALRLRPELCSKGKGATAHIRDSEGRKDDAVWGKRSAWVAYTGVVDGKTVTVAMFDHPDNLRHPTWWHARDYGLVAANPFGQHDFEGAAKGAGDYTLPKGGKLTLRYCLWLAAGAADDAAIARAVEDWLGSVRVR